jgi:hypothetical protein
MYLYLFQLIAAVPEISNPEIAVPLTSSVELQTPCALTANTPRKKKLRKQVKTLEKENNRLRKEVEELKLQSSPNLNQFQKLCDHFLPEQISSFVKVQLNQTNRSENGRRYSDEFKRLCISLYFLGPKCYKQLQKTFFLPSPQALRRFVSHIKFPAGFNEHLFKLLQIKVDKMSEEDRICILSVDEMALKCNLFYNYGDDEIIGFEDNGITKTLKPASSCMVFMARGLKNNWKQPLGYMFSATGYSAKDTKTLLEKFVAGLTNIGLDVKALVTDMGSNFIEMSNLLGVTAEHPTFILGEKELLYFFDPPHLIKAMRNNMLLNEFRWLDCKTSWEYVKDFYGKDQMLKNRMAPKLTNSHVNPSTFEKMRVKFATQVLSATVASGIETYISLGALPKDATGTWEFISIMDKLFDIFNSSTFDTAKTFRKPFAGTENQLTFLNETLQFLENVKVYNVSGKDITTYMKCITGWCISIQSLIKLWDILKNQGFSFLLTRRVNQDPLENFFGTVRQQGGNSVNPTPHQFKLAFRKLFLSDFLHADSMNCEEDMAKMLSSMDNLPRQPATETRSSCGQSFQVEHCDYHKQTLPEQNAFKYVCGYLLNKSLLKHSCDVCKQFAKNDAALDSSNLFLHFKAYSTDDNLFGNLKTAPEMFYGYVYTLETRFFENIEQYLIKRGVGHSMYNLLKSVSCFNHPCTHFPMDYLLKLFIRLRIFYILKFSNRQFKTATKKNRKLCILLNL